MNSALRPREGGVTRREFIASTAAAGTALLSAPSLLAEEEIVRLVEGLLKHLRLSPDAEATLEANPNDLTPEKLDIYRQLGFNRISLGVQSLDDRDLEFLGRRHTAREAGRAMELIRTGGFPIMGIDLIYGLPGQTDKQWESKPRFIPAVNTKDFSRVFVIDYIKKGARYNVLDIFHGDNTPDFKVWAFSGSSSYATGGRRARQWPSS